MFRLDEALKVYLHREPIDFRLNINGLAMLVEQALGLYPFAACVYVCSTEWASPPIEPAFKESFFKAS